MAKRKANKKTIENKAEKVTVENKATFTPEKKTEVKAPQKYNGFVVMGGMTIKMAEPKARLLVKQGRAKFA